MKNLRKLEQDIPKQATDTFGGVPFLGQIDCKPCVIAELKGTKWSIEVTK